MKYRWNWAITASVWSEVPSLRNMYKTLKQQRESNRAEARRRRRVLECWFQSEGWHGKGQVWVGRSHIITSRTMLLPCSVVASWWGEDIDRQRDIQTDRKQGRVRGKERKTEIRGEGGIIIPSINPIADVLLVLGCEGVACDPVHLRPNERLTDWLTSLCQCVCMLDQILLDAGPGNDLGAYGGRKKGHLRTLSECRGHKVN